MTPLETLEPIKHYRLLKELGEGTSGVVWKASKRGQEYAIKILKPGFEHFVLAEFATLQKLDHPNIIQEYEVGTFDTQYCHTEAVDQPEILNGRVALVMELLQGTPMEKARQEDYSPQELEQIVIGMAKGLHAAHQAGVIHRDLKPANVFISPDKQAKILDFGVASGISRDPNEQLVAGSYSYMAPAQLLGKANLQNDIWSFGVTCYQFLTGRHPYASHTLEELSEKMLMLEVDLPSHVNPLVPSKLSYVIAKCLRKNLRDRYRNFEGILYDLSQDPSRKVMTQLGIKRPKKMVRTLLRRQKANNFWMLFGMIFLTVLSLVGLVFAAITGFELFSLPTWPVLLLISLVAIFEVTRRGILMSRKQIENWLQLFKTAALLPAEDYHRLITELQNSDWQSQTNKEDKEYLIFWNWKYGQPEIANKLADELYGTDDQNVTALNFFVQKYYQEKNLDKVREYGRRLLDLSPEDVIRLFFRQVLKWEEPPVAQEVNQLAATVVSETATASSAKEDVSALRSEIFESGWLQLNCHIKEKDLQPFLMDLETPVEGYQGPGSLHEKIIVPAPMAMQLVLYDSYLENKNDLSSDIFPSTLPYGAIKAYSEQGCLVQLKKHGWVRLSFGWEKQRNNWLDFLGDLEVPELTEVITATLTHANGQPLRDECWYIEEQKEDLPTIKPEEGSDDKEIKRHKIIRTHTPFYKNRARRVMFLVKEDHLECLSEEDLVPQNIAFSSLEIQPGPNPILWVDTQKWYQLQFEAPEMMERWQQMLTPKLGAISGPVFAAELLAYNLHALVEENRQIVKTEWHRDDGSLLGKEKKTDEEEFAWEISSPEGILLICREKALEVVSDKLKGTFPYEDIRLALNGLMIGVQDSHWLSLRFSNPDEKQQWQSVILEKPINRQPWSEAESQWITGDSANKGWLGSMLESADDKYPDVMKTLLRYSLLSRAEQKNPGTEKLKARPFVIEPEKMQLSYQDRSIDFLSINRIRISRERCRILLENGELLADFPFGSTEYQAYLPVFCYYWGDRMELEA